jgi:hypothetical protein
MSKAKLVSFLDKLDKELKASSEDYRRATTNKQYTTFMFRSSTIRKTLKTLLDNATNFEGRSGKSILEGINKELSKELKQLNQTIRQNFLESQAQSKGTIEVKFVRGGITVFIEKTDKRDNFALIQRQYKEALDTFYIKFIELLGRPIIRSSKTQGFVDVDVAGKAFNLEHTQKSSNIALFINDAIYKALSDEYGSEAPPSDIQDELKKRGLNDIIKIIKNIKDDSVELFIGSQIKNVIESSKEKALKTKLEGKIQKALLKLDVANVTGSDSLVTGKRKKVIRKITDPFKKIKGVKVTTENLKIDGAITSAEKPIKTSIKKTSRKSMPLTKRAVKGSRGSGKTTGTGFSQVKLYAALNTRINAVVAKNMDLPGLEYQTGRFASGVKITDVSKTPQGFPSIGYTYQLYPYQTFEPGFAQGSTDRDPRKLIDRSIREIAAEMVTGRLYTRRQ